MSRYRLVVDQRERAVFDSLNLEMGLLKDAIDYEIQTLTVGDYAVIENKTEILVAIFERKTLESDFPASIRDGRYENKEKMIKAREKTNCILYYLVEGPLDPPPDKYFSRIPYKTIESAMFHLEVRDEFHIMRTKDITDTIQKLIRFIRSMETIDPVSIVKGGSEPSSVKADAMEVITEKHERRDIDVLREMWSCLKGISISSADTYINKYTLKNLVRGEIKPDALKTPNGKLISKITKKSLSNAHNDTALCEKLLSKIPGIGVKTAKELITASNTLGALLSYEAEAISIMKVGKSKKSLGLNKATAILKYFNLCYSSPNAPVSKDYSSPNAPVSST